MSLWKRFPGFVAIAIAIVCFFSITSSGWAQCPAPTSVPPFTDTTSFAGVNFMEYIGTGPCQVEVAVCIRHLADGTLQMFFEGIWYPPPPYSGGCDTIMTPDNLIKAAVLKVLGDGNAFGPFFLTLCPDRTTVTQVIVADCWALHHSRPLTSQP